MPTILVEAGCPEELVRNPLTGKRMTFERSPGNFSVRTVDGHKYLCFYYLTGREYRVELPPPGEDDEAPR